MKKKAFPLILVGIEAVLLVLILFVPFPVGVIRGLQFSAVALAFLYALIRLFTGKIHLFLLFGLLLTVISDFFLVLLPDVDKAFPMTTFFFAQLCYAAAIYFAGIPVLRLVHLIVRGVLSLVGILIAVIVLWGRVDYLAIISILYFVNLLVNVVFALIQFWKRPFLAVGLLLFLCCDLFIGLQSATSLGYFPLPDWLHAMVFAPFNFAWLFYIPSQTLIALESGR